MVLALAVVSAFASGACPAAEIAAKQEASGAIRVVVPSVFETTFTKRKGFGATWFDLKHDPKKERDIAPVLDENGFFWVKLGKPGTDASWYANPAEEMELLEAGPTRVRVQTRGPHTRYGNADRAAQWKECRYELVFTLYPTGNVYIAYTLEQGEPVPYRDFRVITKSTGAWGENGSGAGKNEVQVAGEAGQARPSRDNKTETAFALQWSNGPTYFTDILMVAYKGKYGAAYWNEGFQDKDMRTSLDLGGLGARRPLVGSASWEGRTGSLRGGVGTAVELDGPPRRRRKGIDNEHKRCFADGMVCSDDLCGGSGCRCRRALARRRSAGTQADAQPRAGLADRVAGRAGTWSECVGALARAQPRR
jgi:hypothetical protein